MIWLPLLLAVMVVLACLMAWDFKRERDGAREAALQAKQGWDRALERETNAVVRALALEIERDLCATCGRRPRRMRWTAS